MPLRGLLLLAGGQSQRIGLTSIFFNKPDEIGIAMLKQFEKFDPISGRVPEYPFYLLPEIARRARAILVGNTVDQIETAAEGIDLEIETYFSDLRDQAVYELTVKFENDQETYQDFFEWDGGTLANGYYIFRNEMDESLDIATAENSSEVDALKTIIEDRDSCSSSLKISPIPETDHWSEGRTDELFAVLALKLVGNCLNLTSYEDSRTIHSNSARFALEAMDAVCFAEQAKEVKWMEQFHKKQLLEALEVQKSHLSSVSEKVRTDLIAEQIDHERIKRTTRSSQMNAARHQTTKNAKDLVNEAWEKVCNDFPSAEQAGIYYADWLEEQSIGYQLKGSEVFYQPRTVTGWIRQCAKEKGIRFR